jgi:hypothetical protein
MSKWLPYEEERRRRRAYRWARTDAEAAERLGMPVAAFRGWRRTRLLPSKTLKARMRDKKPKGGQRLSAEEESRRRQAYESTASDAEACRLLGVRPETFWTWRTSRGLPPKRPRGRRKP